MKLPRKLPRSRVISRYSSILFLFGLLAATFGVEDPTLPARIKSADAVVVGRLQIESYNLIADAGFTPTGGVILSYHVGRIHATKALRPGTNINGYPVMIRSDFRTVTNGMRGVWLLRYEFPGADRYIVLRPITNALEEVEREIIEAQRVHPLRARPLIPGRWLCSASVNALAVGEKRLAVVPPVRERRRNKR